MRSLAALFFCILLAGCATPYQKASFLDSAGYTDVLLQPGYYRVSYNYSNQTSRESVQTYLLCRCAQLTLELGYDGFQVVSPPPFARLHEAAPRVQLAHAGGGGVIFIPGGSVGFGPMTVDIKLLKAPITPKPPITFDARLLTAQLTPIMNAPKCNGNICPHLHSYLFPNG